MEPNSPDQLTPDLRPKWLAWAIVALVVVALVAGIAALRHHPTTSTGNPTNVNQVSITTTGFSPKLIQVKAGQSVSWVNNDTANHWIASDPYPKNDTLPGLSSQGPLKPGDSYSYLFDKPGTYSYHDQLNPYKLLGTVEVK